MARAMTMTRNVQEFIGVNILINIMRSIPEGHSAQSNHREDLIPVDHHWLIYPNILIGKPFILLTLLSRFGTIRPYLWPSGGSIKNARIHC